MTTLKQIIREYSGVVLFEEDYIKIVKEWLQQKQLTYVYANSRSEGEVRDELLENLE